MADTTDMAPTAPATTSRRKVNGGRATRASSRARAQAREQGLEQQVARLQEDLKSIAATIAGLADEKVSEARGTAKSEVRNLVHKGQHAVEEIQDEFGHIEKQLKDTIRQRPLTAVLGAIAVGFVLALLTR
jgi:ElaB/YqjD/DUF883 family membrane-anchored ribosome-binding protein